ncbi:hypothetical protein DPEC_G00135030 [Dallia pectoralis]|uniref:Uncharacterized protein n=1 Tax=Dallia pectoralis TaxID=75939 RepID=A0ACC2GS93_DALPE|nr:hypothetical protein DPEC_G00135030 [Dallia pectoralis]
MDDVLIWEPHRQSMMRDCREVLSRPGGGSDAQHFKCEFSKSRIKFLGQVIGASGVSADLIKEVSAVSYAQHPVTSASQDGAVLLQRYTDRVSLWRTPQELSATLNGVMPRSRKRR